MSDGPLNRAYLALGSNINPEQNLSAAVAALAQYGRIAAVSRVWESAALGDVNQADFLNAAVLLETALSADELKQSAIREVEATLERVRDPANKNAARTIDVDIALWNREVLTVAGNQIPDPEILTRPFLAVPLAELDAAYEHPTDGRTLGTIAAALGKKRLSLRDDLHLM